MSRHMVLEYAAFLAVHQPKVELSGCSNKENQLERSRN